METLDAKWRKLVEELRDISQRSSEKPAYVGMARGPLIGDVPNLMLYSDSLDAGSDYLVHYTSWENVLNMFNEKVPALRMYNFEKSNDPNDGKIRPREWEDVLEKTNWIDDILMSDGSWANDLEYGCVYGCSFTSGEKGVEDDLTYWRMYGNNGRGCSLKITPPDAWAPDAPKQRIYEVRYRSGQRTGRYDQGGDEDKNVAEKLKEIIAICEDLVDRASDGHQNEVRKIIARWLRRIIYTQFYMFKHEAYADEREWRMIKVAPRSNEILYDVDSKNLVRRYVKGPYLVHALSSGSVITIGPDVDNAAAARSYIEHQARDIHGIQHVQVKNSTKLYRPGS